MRRVVALQPVPPSTHRGDETRATTRTAKDLGHDGIADAGVRIALDPHRPGVERARLVEYGVPAWALIAYMGGEGGDITRTAQDYGIPEAAVRAAIAHYREHRSAIDALLDTLRAGAS